MQEQGVLSYYAARALPEVETVGDWLAAITELAGGDARSGRLPKTHRPQLQLLGDGAAGWPVIGARAAR